MGAAGGIAAKPPPPQQPPPQPPPPPPEEAAVIALTLLLLTGVVGTALAEQAAAILAPLGISAAAAQSAIALTVAQPLAVDVAVTGPAGARVRRSAVAFRAGYLLAASRRLQQAQDKRAALAAERRHLAAHLNADRSRREAATRVDGAAVRYGSTLGWYSIRDEATTAGCRAAHGKNFSPTDWPMIEGVPSLPGTLHGGACRCLPGPPIAGATMLPT